MKPRIGIALGSGAARGWGHIGVLRALADIGIHPEVVCGTSIGALVGAAYASGQLERLQAWITGLSWSGFLRMFDVQLGAGGLVQGERFVQVLRGETPDLRIEDLALAYAAVATDFETGQEVWLQSGSLFESVRASIAMPGLFAPVQHEGRLLLDGGLVNPVPVSVCRALGADRVIAVNINADIVGRHGSTRAVRRAPRPDLSGDGDRDLLSRLSEHLTRGLRELAGGASSALPERHRPGLLDIVAGSLNIMQDRITRSRMAGDPPDLTLSLRLAHIGLLDFTRAAETIAEGERSVRAMRPALDDLVSGWGQVLQSNTRSSL